MTQKELEKYMPNFLENGDIECYAHPISLGTYEKMTGNLELFRQCYREVYDGFHQNNYLYFMLSRCNEDTNPNGPIYAVDTDGKLTYSFYDNVKNYLRIELHPEYDPNSKIVKSYHDKVKALLPVGKNTTSSAPAVKVGGIEYIWTNRQQCLDGTENTMTLVSDKVHDALTQTVVSNPDFTISTLSKLLQRECTNIALERCDKEELALLRCGTLSRADNYKNWQELPTLEENNYENFEETEQIDFFDEVENDEIGK